MSYYFFREVQNFSRPNKVVVLAVLHCRSIRYSVVSFPTQGGCGRWVLVLRGTVLLGNLFIFGKKYLIAALAFFLGFLGSFSWDARVLEDNPLHLRSFISFEDFLVSRIPFAVPRLHFITGLLFIFTARLPSVAILVFFPTLPPCLLELRAR